MMTPIVFLFALGILTRSASNVVPEIGCGTMDFSGVGSFESLAQFEQQEVLVPNVLAESNIETNVLGVAEPSERWIEIDLSDQKLYAWNGNQLYLETLISSGLPGTPTPTGEFRVWIKLRATKMEGGEGRNYYYLPNVPYVMFFENKDVPGWRGYGIHGTYWHSDFGNPRSHGCINTPTHIAEKLYYWTTPELPAGKYTVYSSDENPGIRVIIHE